VFTALFGPDNSTKKQQYAAFNAKLHSLALLDEFDFEYYDVTKWKLVVEGHTFPQEQKYFKPENMTMEKCAIVILSNLNPRIVRRIYGDVIGDSLLKRIIEIEAIPFDGDEDYINFPVEFIEDELSVDITVDDLQVDGNPDIDNQVVGNPVVDSPVEFIEDELYVDIPIVDIPADDNPVDDTIDDDLPDIGLGSSISSKPPSPQKTKSAITVTPVNPSMPCASMFNTTATFNPFTSFTSVVNPSSPCTSGFNSSSPCTSKSLSRGSSFSAPGKVTKDFRQSETVASSVLNKPGVLNKIFDNESDALYQKKSTFLSKIISAENNDSEMIQDSDSDDDTCSSDDESEFINLSKCSEAKSCDDEIIVVAYKPASKNSDALLIKEEPEAK